MPRRLRYAAVVPGPPGSPGIAGPAGVVTTTSASYQQPQAGVPVLVHVLSTQFAAIGIPVTVTTPGGAFAGVYVISAFDPVGLTVTLQWQTSGGGVSTGTTIQNGSSIFPSALPGTSPLGTTVVGTTTVGNLTADWAGVAAGTTFPAWRIPAPNLGAGELAMAAFAVNVVANPTPPTVSAATGNGVPIVLTISSVLALANNERVFVFGVLGNAAANGGSFIQISGSTIALFSDKGCTVPVVGNGAYTSGGTVLSRGFAHFEHRATFRECDGVVLSTNFDSSDSDVTSPAPPLNATPSMLNTAVSIVPNAEGIEVRVTAPANVPVLAQLVGSFSRSPLPGAGSAPTISGIFQDQACTIPLTSGPCEGATTLFALGTGFTGTVGVAVAGVSASFSVLDSQHIQILTTQEPTGLGVTGQVVVTTINGTTVNPAVTYQYVTSVFSIFGYSTTNLRGDYTPASIQQTAGNVTSWQDASGNGNNINPLDGTVTYNASSSMTSPAGPTASWGGAASMSLLFSLASIGVPTGFFAWCVIKITGGTPGGVISYLGANMWGLVYDVAGQGVGVPGIFTGGSTPWTGSVQNVRSRIAIFLPGGVSGSGTKYISVNNGTAQTAAAPNESMASQTLTIGKNTQFPVFGTFEMARMVIAAIPPSAPQLAALDALGVRLYGA